MNEKNPNNIEIALWEKTSKSGIKYYGGSTDTHWVSVFKNHNKKSDKSPDLNIVMSPKDPNYVKPQQKTETRDFKSGNWQEDAIPF